MQNAHKIQYIKIIFFEIFWFRESCIISFPKLGILFFSFEISTKHTMNLIIGKRI